jgi:hypothetical protein
MEVGDFQAPSDKMMFNIAWQSVANGARGSPDVPWVLSLHPGSRHRALTSAAAPWILLASANHACGWVGC